MFATIPGQLLTSILVRWVSVTCIVLGLTLILAPMLLAPLDWPLRLITISGSAGAVICGVGLTATWTGPAALRQTSGLLLLTLGTFSLLSWSAPDVLILLMPFLATAEVIVTGSLQAFWISAVLFVSVGLTFLIPPSHPIGRRCWQVIGMIWASVGLVLIAGHWFPGVSGMIASHPAGSTLIALFMTFLGGALWCVARNDSLQNISLKPTTWVIGLGGFLLSCLIWFSLNVQHHSDQQQSATTVANNMETALNQLLRGHFVSMDRMVSGWNNLGLLFNIEQGTLNPEIITSATVFLTDLRSFDALALWVPARQSDPEVLTARSRPEAHWAQWLSRDSVLACQQDSLWLCTLQYFPEQEDYAGRLMMAVPLTNTPGMLLGLVNMDTLMANHLHLEVEPYSIAVHQGDELVYARGPSDEPAGQGAPMYTAEAPLFGMQEFTITVWHSDAADAIRLPNLIMLASLVGLLLSIVIALTAELSLTNANRSRALSQSVIRQRQLRTIEEMIAREKPLYDIIDTISYHLDSQLPGAHSLLLIRHDERMPDQLTVYGNACALKDLLRQQARLSTDSPLAQARQTGRPVMIPDLTTDHRWPHYTNRLLREELHACFTFPVLSAAQQVLGLVVILRQRPGMMELDDLGKVDEAIPLVALAMDQKHSKSALVHASRYDHLTDLPNRAYLQQQLHDWFKAGNAFSLLFIDLDGFKPINDSLGHATGDQVLIQVAARINQIFPAPAFTGRLGGDEFVILVPDITGASESQRRKAIENCLQDLLDTLAETYQVDDIQVSLTASIGATRVQPTDRRQTDPMIFLQEADLAMYKAKHRGRNNFEWYEPGDQSRQHLKVQLRHDIQRALANQEFRLHYQPIIGHDGSVQGVEALLRWEHPEKGMISPGIFIPLAEETGQIIPISDWVLQQACADAKTLQSFGTTRVSINISPVQFQRANFQQQIVSAIEHHGLAPDLLSIELTEHTLLEAQDTVTGILTTLSLQGIGIAIDDFGTGFSSLSYLKWLPVSSLKIDRSFIVDMLHSERDDALVRAIIDMAHELGLTAVAEGVETTEQAQRLKELGCDQQQGYYFARPKDFNALQVWLSSYQEWLTNESVDGTSGR